MKMRSLLGIFSIVLFTGFVFGQVQHDWNDPDLGTMGYGVGWGAPLTSVEWLDDPTWGGVLALNYSTAGGEGGAMKNPSMDIGWDDTTTGAAFVSFDVYLPEDFPGDALVKFWGRDMINWPWIDFKYSPTGVENGRPMIIGGWTTIYYDVHYAMEQYGLTPWNMEGGLECWFGSAWEGTVLVDNFTWWGVEADLQTGFDAGTDGWFRGWGNGGTVSWLDHPEFGGVLDITVDTGGFAWMIDPMELGWTEFEQGAAYISFDVYIPADFAEQQMIKLWAQDTVNWNWIDYKYSYPAGINGAWGLTPGEWNTLVFPVLLTHQNNNGWLPWSTKGGMELWQGDGVTWLGDLYVDNVRLHDSEVGLKWVVSNFENSDNGTAGFGNTGWNQSMTSIHWAADPTGNSAGVLMTDWDFDLDPSRKAQFVNSAIDLQWTTDDLGEVVPGATAFSFDVFIPEDLPFGVTFSVWATDLVNWTWIEYAYTLVDPDAGGEERPFEVNLVRGEWGTIYFDVLDALENNPDNFDIVGQTIRGGIQVLLPAGGPNWIGSIPFDNFTQIGVGPPPGQLQPVEITGLTAHNAYNRVAWADNEDNLQETYYVYMSENPITDLNADGVVLMAPGVSRGVNYWQHGLYTLEPMEQTFYYAVTAVGLDGTATDLGPNSVTGPITNTSREAPRGYYEPTFADSWVLDADLSEFDAYADFTLFPETASGIEAGGWSLESIDLNYRLNYVFDDDYMYLAAEVWDDDPTAEGQAWEGDAIELFQSFYAIQGLSEWHDLGDVGSAGTGDFRVSYHAMGHTESGGSSIYEYPGLDYVIEQNAFGYNIEARYHLDTFNGDNYDPMLGDLLPIRIDCNDMDPINGDEERTLQLHSFGQANSQNWLRPSSWGYMIVFAPELLADGDVNGDGNIDVLDVVAIVAHILQTTLLPESAIVHADINMDGNVDILDIVAVVAEILSNRIAGEPASEASIFLNDGKATLNADGVVQAVQMTLSHGDDFSIQMTDNAYLAESSTVDGITRLVVVYPEDDVIFTTTGGFKIEENLIASGGEFVNSSVVNGYAMLSNYPNPFNPTTQINYNLPTQSLVNVSIYNMLGQNVSTLVSGMQDAGEYSVLWNGVNDAGNPVPSGIYFVKMNHNNETLSQKITLLK